MRKAALALALAATIASPAALAQTVSPKAFVRDDIAASASQFEDKIKREVPLPAGADAARFIREAEALIGRNDPRAALPLANQAVRAAPNSVAAWRLVSRVARLVTPRDWQERYELSERAVSAAYTAYLRATTKADEAASLAQLAETFEWRQMWRPALTAYRISLEANDVAAVRTAYESLREKRGFRLREYNVEADLAAPRACFDFTEPLARGRVDFAPYVAVTGRGDFAVQAEDARLCIAGLRHGERYAIVLRQGIPSAIPGESLLKSADYEVYVRDRAPSVRASGKAYVLPRTGQQGLPITSVNTEVIGLKVLRIGDRNLINTVRSPEFLEQLEAYQVENIVKESGQLVWQGTMTAKGELNKDVVTAFPVLEAAGRLQPGVYVLAAQAGEYKDGRTSRYDGDGVDLDQVATQWFIVSDLGLTALSGNDGISVMVRSLASAGPIADTEVTLVARNNEILGTAKTDRNGFVKFDAGLGRGEGGLAPGMVTAKAGEDYGFLNLTQTAFDLTDRGVSGRIAPKGLDAFVYAERGVYRPGETVHLAALVRDARGAGITGLPVTLVVRRPDGMEYRRTIVEDQGGGGRALSVPLLSGAPVGTWRASVYSDPKRPAIGETTFLVEDYVPERLEITLEPKAKVIVSGQEAEIDVSVRYLYGAPGAELEISGETTVRRAAGSAIPGFAGYRVGVEDEPVEPVKNEIENRPTTDENGKAELSVAIKEPETRLPLEVEFTITANETGGRGVTRSLTLPILPKGAVIGVKPLFEDGEIGEGGTAKFAVIMATGEGRRLARPGLKWQLSKISRNYQWFFKEGRWTYEAIKTSRRVADGEIATSETAIAEIAARVGWGTYRLEVRSGGADDAETAFDFNVGYVSEAKADTPDVLDIALDKKGYEPGETMQVKLSPRFAGKATLAVISDRIAHIELVDMPEGGITVPLRVSAEWGAGAYLVAFAHRPLDVAASRMPGRAIGLTWFSVGKEARKVAVNLGAPPLVRPRGELALPIRIGNLRPGDEAYVTVAAVDVGILNLTRYQAPNPSEYFFGQRQLSTELRDLYSYLIDGMSGTRGQIRAGGDAALPAKGEKPTQEPLARFSGVVKVGPDGSVPISFELPAFNGTVRVMAVAWTKDRTGEASADVIVRDPVVVQATTPRFLALGDRSRFHLDINNVEGESGDYALDVEMKGPISLSLDPALRRIRLERGRKTSFSLPVIAAGLGVAEVDLTLKGPGGMSLGQTLRLPVKPSAPSVANRIVRPLGPGQSLSVSNDLVGDMVPQSGSVAVTVSPFGALDVPALLASLDRYPYGCTEQTISRAMPLLYLNRLASLEQLAIDDNAERRITSAIERVLARQDASGSFGLWSIGGNDIWLDSFVADFLTRARERNIAVPQTAFTLLLDRLRNRVANAGDLEVDSAAGIAYALYVLARNGRPMMGDLRYMVDNKLGEFKSPLAKGQLAAALALLGDRTRARTAFEAAQATLVAQREDGLFRYDYGSKLRDAAGLLALLAEGNAERAQVVRVAAELDTARQTARYTSTQEQLWMVLAAQALTREAESFALTVDGAGHRGALYRNLTAARLERAPMVIRNETQTEARVVLSVSGIPLSPAPAVDEGYAVERSIRNFEGEVVQPGELKQNERYVVMLTISEKVVRGARLLVVDPLPAGLEIENPNLGGGASTEGFSFLGDVPTPETTEARDDRFVAAFNRTGSSPKSFNIGYIVRAVTPGRYVHPAAIAEDMYRPERFGRTAFGTVDIAAPEAAKRQ